MKILKFFTLIFSIFIIESQSVLIDCIYEVDPSYGYKCSVLNSYLITSKDERIITEIRGQHLNGKTRDDVKFFSSYEKKVNYFPRSLTKVYRNIERVKIYGANLREITKDDLEQFGDKLKSLWLYNNKIEVIESDLFSANKNLEEIHLGTNKIKHIQNGAFNGLEKLLELHLQSNPCTGGDDWADSRHKMLQVIRRVNDKCKDPAYSFLEGKNEEIKKLKEEISILKGENKRLRDTCRG